MEPREQQEELQRLVAEAKAAEDALRDVRKVAEEERVKLEKAKRNHKVADRPHIATLATSIITAGLTLWALWFTHTSITTSRDALEISQQSLEIGQRAYVAIQSPKFEFLDNSTRGSLLNLDKPYAQQDHRTFVGLQMTLEIANTGNTPADMSTMRFTFKLPNGWSLDLPEFGLDQKGSNVIEAPSIGSVGGRSSRQIKYRFGFALEEDAANVHRRKLREKYSEYFFELLSSSDVEVEARVSYTDVFHKKSNLAWCGTPTYQSDTLLPCSLTK